MAVPGGLDRLSLVALCVIVMTSGLDARPVKVMSYNILHGVDASGRNTLKQQGEAIRVEDPDFVGLQEVDVGVKRSGKVDEMAKLAEVTGLHRAFAAHFDYQGGEYGNGILSRFPLSDIRNDRISLFTTSGTRETRALLSAVATLPGGTTVTVASVHLGLNVQSRVAQAAEVCEFLSARGGAVILIGDFNAEPGTKEIAILLKMFASVGDPLQFTFPVGKASKTIDYIMVSRNDLGVVKGYRVMKDTPYSDHYPLIAEFELE